MPCTPLSERADRLVLVKLLARSLQVLCYCGCTAPLCAAGRQGSLRAGEQDARRPACVAALRPAKAQKRAVVVERDGGKKREFPISFLKAE
jgi:hypothetical protein